MENKEKELLGTRVLVAEDEPIIAMDHADHLIDAGAHVIGPCALVSQAMECLQKDEVDFAVIDYVLGDGNTDALQEALEEKRVPYVIVTSYPRVLVRRGDQTIQSKPVTSEGLLAAIRREKRRQAA